MNLKLTIEVSPKLLAEIADILFTVANYAVKLTANDTAVKLSGDNKDTKVKEKAETKVTAEELREKFVALARKNKREELKALLANYSVENVSALPEAVFDEVYAKLEAM